MTRAELIGRILRGSRITRLQAEMLVETILDCLQQSLLRGEQVELRALGRSTSGAAVHTEDATRAPAKPSRSKRDGCPS